MKSTTTLALLLGLAVMPALGVAEEAVMDETTVETVKVETEAQKASYAIGMEIGANLSMIPAELDANALIKGLYDTLLGRDLAMTEEEAEMTKQAFFMKMQELEAERATKAAETNLLAGKEFLAANKEKEGVKETASGLQYKVVEEGDGEKPAATATVKVHYRGTLLDGTEFDSSYSRNSAAQFPLNGVIPGWTEGLQLMNVGSKYRFFIPSGLAYGMRGSPPAIEPNSTLIFDVELIEIVN